MPKRPLTKRELLKRLKPFGVISLKKKGTGKKRGKGSEIILVLPIEEGSTRGPSHPIKDHGKGTEIYIPVIESVLRRFNIDPDEFWD
ncbi:MAG: type II toxin-antitoxin system HicA family toxin [Pseudomonadota bacterium]